MQSAIADTGESRDALALDDEARYRAMCSRDARFDGRFFIGVLTTGIYCRPSCPTPVQPLRRNVDFYPTAAAAQLAGFRACKRCRPDATPGSPEWNLRSDLVGRALRLISDGVVDREGVQGLARHLAVSERHLHRVLSDGVGAGPIALARAQRAHTARLLIETTRVPFADVAFASGFSSVRQFNDTVREVFAVAPTALRASSSARRDGGRGHTTTGAGPTTIRLAVRTPFDHVHLWRFLSARAVAGVESMQGGTYSRSLLLDHGPAVVELTPAEDHVTATFHLDDLRDLAAAVARTRRLLDLDADPVAIDDALASDPALQDLVRLNPGRRSPGALDPHELAVRAVLGQQVSVAAARRVAERIADRFGTPLARPVGPVDRCFPDAVTLAAVDPTDLGVPRARGRAVVALSTALADGTVALDAGSDRLSTVGALLRIPGIGPWTASYIVMRALSDPDVFLATDAAARSGAARLGLPDTPDILADHASRWSPWRSYATHHLWGAATGATPPEQPESPPPKEQRMPTDPRSRRSSGRRTDRTALRMASVESPVGGLRVVVSDRGLRAVLWEVDEGRVAVGDPQPISAEDDPVAEATVSQLTEYFEGSRTRFDLPLDLLGTEFQVLVWRSLGAIPFGATRSYAQQASDIGRPKAVRAVGAANGRNPVSIVLPCHRVVGADGSLTGFAAGLDAKRFLLAHEQAVLAGAPTPG